MNKYQEFSIIVAARNEERTIFEALTSISRSAMTILGSSRCELIVVLNSCIDNTESETNRFVQSCSSNPIFNYITILNSKPGLISAQLTGISARNLRGPILFFDADILISKNCIPNLLDTLDDNGTQVAYARNEIAKCKFSFFTYVINFHHLCKDIRTPRRYFHGRAYALKDYPFKLHGDCDLKILNSSSLHFLDLDTGPQVDDIYLSRVFAHRNGADCMKECKGATVFFLPITSLADFYFALRRSYFEIWRLDILFPEHQYLQTTLFERKIDKFLLSKISVREQLALLCGLSLERSIKFLLKIEFRVRTYLPFCGNKVLTLWPALLTTKGENNATS